MWLEDVQSETKIFIDANIFLYNILKPNEWFESCNQFLKTVEGGEIKAFTSSIVIGEVIHKLMISEVVKKYEKKASEAVSFLKRNPKKVKALNKYSKIIEDIKHLPITLLSVSRNSVITASELIKDHGLLTNDALHLGTMKENNISNLASNDSDFKRVAWIDLYKPSE